MMGKITRSRGWRRLVGMLVAGALTGVAQAGQMDAATYYLLREGMSMSEVLVRAGPPDLVTLPGGEVVQRRFGSRGGGEFRRSRIRNIEEWHYIPGPDYHDPWITLVTFRSGRILDVRRTKVFSRYRGSRSNPGDAARSRQRATSAGSDQASRTLEAAERYAATRLRLKEKVRQEDGGSEQASASSSPKIYRGTDDHGATYFGDVPLE